MNVLIATQAVCLVESHRSAQAPAGASSLRDIEGGEPMDLRTALRAAAEDSALERRWLYESLLPASLFVRTPLEKSPPLTNPESGRRALPAFLTEHEAESFWAAFIPKGAIEVGPISFLVVAARALQVGGLVLDPAGANIVLERDELLPLANAEVPGQFASWLRGLGRLGRSDAEVLRRFRPSHVHVITDRQSQRLYLLERSSDGVLAVPCFTSSESLGQFAQIRGLFARPDQYGVSMVAGERCLRAAAGMGAYVLIDPESPWETQVEPPLL